MATVTLSTYANYVAGTTGVGRGDVLTRAGGDTDTVILPVDAPVGFSFFVGQEGAGTVTIDVGAGGTVTGNTSLAADNTYVMVVKVSTTDWNAAIYEDVA